MMANDEKIIEMLKKKGEIPENATPEEINKALQNYLKKKAPEPGSLQDEKAKKKYINHLKEQIQKNGKATP
jgi:bacillopeptidase F (M6 metalloprotease family)